MNAEVDSVEGWKDTKAGLSKLFAEVKNGNTPVMAERILNDIDQIVRVVRFPGRQDPTKEGEIRKALREHLYKKYKGTSE